MKFFYYIKKLRKPMPDGINHVKSQNFKTFEEMYNDCPVTRKAFDGKYPCEVMRGISAEEHMHDLLALINCPVLYQNTHNGASTWGADVYDDDSFTTHDADLAAEIREEVESIVFYCETIPD